MRCQLRRIRHVAVLLVLVFGVGCSKSLGNGFDLTTTPNQLSMPTVDIPTATFAIELISPTPFISPTEEYSQPSLILIPAGEFQMGALPEVGFQICVEIRQGCSLEDFVDEAPVHNIYLDDYWIFKYEVTNAFYLKCVEAGVCDEPIFTEFYYNPLYAEHPVVHVNWFAASQFCEWSGGRLPTEAEWEKAALGDTGWVYPWGDEADCEKANFSGCNFDEVTLPVGSYPDGASVFGVMDMAGNAAEWIFDWYDPEYYSVSPMENPEGPADGELRSARGGSWKNPTVGIRSTNRGGNFPEVFSSGVGFRCVVLP